MRFDAVQKVESIPVLGTGKTDYKALRRQVEVMSEENTDLKPTEAV
jgi:non-ribosomal peptide synthetase component E (peptide arylation enzyme)